MRSESLRKALDYDAVVAVCRSVVAKRHYPLIEGLAQAIAAAINERFAPHWVELSLAKPGCVEDARGTSIRLRLAGPTDGPTSAPIRAEEVNNPEELLIVGGGPAGMAAAQWAKRLGHTPLLLNQSPQLGGQLHWVHRPMNDLACAPPATGHQLAATMRQRLSEHEVRWLSGCVVELLVDRPSGGVAVLFEHKGQQRLVEARAAVIASGLRRRCLEVPGERSLVGRGILKTGSRETEVLAGKRLVVIGGGDAACENALLLAAECPQADITLVHRGTRLRARSEFVRRLTSSRTVTLRTNCRITRFVGDDHLEAVSVVGPEGAKDLPADAALVRIGWCPNSGLLPRDWLDDAGYLLCDRQGRVACEAPVWAAGDVTRPICPSVANAIGSGATAARAACEALESASA